LRQLLAALREAANGGSVIDSIVVDALVTRRARLRESPLARLTPRELDVLREMAQGRGNAGIAQELSLSESSVENTSTRSSPSWTSPASSLYTGGLLRS
jgi:DNA-binding NarL/FixJ family response regulator